MASVDTEDDQLLTVIYGDHEPDDWAAKHQISLSEMASRLNAKQHYDNRGRQIWTDGVETTTVQWIVAAAGVGTVVRSAAAAWRGGWSVLATTGAAPGDNCTMTKRFYSPQTGRYGVEIAWSSSTNNALYFDIDFQFYTGIDWYRGLLRVNFQTNRYQYWDNVLGFTNIGPVLCARNDIHYWHKMKIVCDMNTGLFVRALVDGHEENLSLAPMVTVGNVTCPHILVRMELMCNPANVADIHLDDFIFTHLEP